MPVEEIAEGALRVLGRAFAQFVVEVVFEVACYFLGLGTLRALSLGAYPRSPLTSRQEFLCMWVGAAELVAGIVAIAFLYS